MKPKRIFICFQKCIVAAIFLFAASRHPYLVQAEKDTNNNDNNLSYYMIAVSGGLQDGYPDRRNLDYIEKNDQGQTVETVKAILLGKVFVRGYKAYLDVMESDWRQYVPPSPPGSNIKVQPLINPDVFPTGCYEHANEYYVYLVDSRQLILTLMGEPRFLSISPDTGLVELRHSSPLMQEIARAEILKGGFTNENEVVLPLVTSVWFQSRAHFPSPIVKVVDGAEVTNFPDSLAIWANAKDSDRLDYIAAHQECLGSGKEKCDIKDHPSYQRYWEAITKAIRNGERTREEWSNDTNQRPLWECKRYVRFGASKGTARLNYPFTKQEFQDLMNSFGSGQDADVKYEVDFDKATITMKS
eukprot:CAMPEP_0178902714 /NCGR_PEP_ID=MMETSP0786-20121207/4761_1 /TAXON_ID=186022 /ORGANISM="Thalassionema frauenfeldii, Strain CCMP 1798" /LENGTH=356 /DNA_ID=CAMNT_0020574017 /DNA_START=34 /DNA_END=1100 /DNA_ORIENTATION=+